MQSVKGLLLKENIHNFLFPLFDLINVGVQKIVLSFSKEAQNVYVHTKTENNVHFIFLDYKKELFSELFIKEDIHFGVYNLSEFMNIVKQFDSHLYFEIEQNKMKITDGNGFVVDYFSANIKNIPTAQKQPQMSESFLDSECLAKVIWSPEYKKKINSFNCLSHNHLLITNNQLHSSISFIVLNKSVSVSDRITFTIPTEVKNNHNFSILLEKDKFCSILANKKEEVKMYIKEKFVCFYIDNKYMTMYHFLTSMKDWGNKK